MRPDKRMENNKVIVTGRIASRFTYSHGSSGERLYRTDMQVKRLSKFDDQIPLLISEKLLDVTRDHTGEFLRVSGNLRSYNRQENGKSRVVLFVFVSEAEFVEAPDSEINNQILLEGHLCKKPIYRRTPFGREITELLLAVNRPYGRTDYIPCICWKRNAKYAAGLGVGAYLQIQGRIQSREYKKRLSETETETRTAYEVSIRELLVELEASAPSILYADN